MPFPTYFLQPTALLCSYNKNVKQLWDLKGSLRNRYATTKTEAPVLLDENLVQDLWGNQLFIHPHSKAALNKAIVNDSHFLCSQVDNA